MKKSEIMAAGINCKFVALSIIPNATLQSLVTHNKNKGCIQGLCDLHCTR